MFTNKKEKGQAIYLIVFGIMVLIGSAALAIDGGRIYLDRREAQNTADSAVLAAALTDCTANGDFIVQARAIAASNGFDNNDPDVSVDVYNPPISGPYTGNSDYYEVVIQSTTEVGLAQLVRQGTFPIEARAVALCEEGTGGTEAVGEGNAIIVLHTSGEGILMNGHNEILVPNGGIQVDSSDSQAIRINGSPNVIDADVISIVGNYGVNGHATITPEPITGAAVMGDPLADLEPPENPYSGSCQNVILNGGQSATLSPGLYCQVILNGSGASIYLESGTYAFTNDFILNGGGTLEASPNGVELLFFNNSVLRSNGSNDITLENSFIYIERAAFINNANDTFTITAPTSGPWAGMAIYSDRNNTSNHTLNGSNNLVVSGTIYAPSSEYIFNGNTSTSVFNAQFIVKVLRMNGNGSLAVDYDPDLLYQVPGGSDSMISLVE